MQNILLPVKAFRKSMRYTNWNHQLIEKSFGIFPTAKKYWQEEIEGLQWPMTNRRLPAVITI